MIDCITALLLISSSCLALLASACIILFLTIWSSACIRSLKSLSLFFFAASTLVTRSCCFSARNLLLASASLCFLAFSLSYFCYFANYSFIRLCLYCSASSLFLITEFHLFFLSSYLCCMAAGFVRWAKETSPDWLLFAISPVYTAKLGWLF